MNKQRLAIVIAAGIGMLATFMPWANAPFIGSLNGTHGQGWTTFVLFGISIVIALLGNRNLSITGNTIYAVVAPSVIAGAIGLWNVLSLQMEKRNLSHSSDPFDRAVGSLGSAMVTTGYGMYMVIIAGIVVAFIAFFIKDAVQNSGTNTTNVVIGMLTTSLLFSGCAKNLDNQTAQNLIINHFRYPKAQTVRFGCGDVLFATLGGNAIKNKEFLDALKERNIITYQSNGIVQTGFFPAMSFTVSLTPEGQKLKTGNDKPDQNSTNPVFIKITELDFFGITSMRKIEGTKYTEVTYSCIQHTTPYAEAFNKVYGGRIIDGKYVNGKIFSYTTRIAETDNG